MSGIILPKNFNIVKFKKFFREIIERRRLLIYSFEHSELKCIELLNKELLHEIFEDGEVEGLCNI